MRTAATRESTVRGPGICLPRVSRRSIFHSLVLYEGSVVKRLILPVVTMAAVLVQGYAAPSHGVTTLAPGAPAGAPAEATAPPAAFDNTTKDVTLCAEGEDCAKPGHAPEGADIGETKDAPAIAGKPLTAVVVTQCNLVVAVYMTMPDGRLLRFDQRSRVPAEDLVGIAYTATRSERVEVSCEGTGTKGYEKHGI
jgi:hypothetical protein